MVSVTESPEFLYHGTVSDNLPSIYGFGLSADWSMHLKGVYLTDDPLLAEYFAERTAEGGGDPVVIKVPITPQLRSGLRGDRKMLMDPTVMQTHDPDVVMELLRSGTTSWRKTLEAVHSVIYRGSDPIRVTPDMVTRIRERRFARFPEVGRFRRVRVKSYQRQR